MYVSRIRIMDMLHLEKFFVEKKMKSMWEECRIFTE